MNTQNESLKVRQELVSYSQMITKKGWVAGPGGNISARWKDIMYLSPSGFAFDDVTPDDFVGIDISNGTIVEGLHRPSSEVLMHLFCYREREDIHAVVHTHPPFALGLISAGVTLKPMFADFVVYLGREIPTLPYITVTTEKLAAAVKEKVKSHNAVLMINHGALTAGTNLKEAYYRADVLEEAARIQWIAMTSGTPRFLSDEECEELKTLSSEKYRQELLRKMTMEG